MTGVLEGKVAVITGGSRGIGRAIAASLAADGADSVLAARGEQDLRRAAAEIAEASGRRAEYFAGDLRSLGGCEAFAETAQRPTAGSISWSIVRARCKEAASWRSPTRCGTMASP